MTDDIPMHCDRWRRSVGHNPHGTCPGHPGRYVDDNVQQLRSSYQPADIPLPDSGTSGDLMNVLPMRTARPGEALPPVPDSAYPPGARPLAGAGLHLIDVYVCDPCSDMTRPMPLGETCDTDGCAFQGLTRPEIGRTLIAHLLNVTRRG